MTKAEIREAIATTDAELERLEKVHGEKVDMRPWMSNEHPISCQHWGLVQKRFRIKDELKKKPSFSPERRAAAPKRLKEGPPRSLNPVRRRFWP
jgi:hypothetical protein